MEKLLVDLYDPNKLILLAVTLTVFLILLRMCPKITGEKAIEIERGLQFVYWLAFVSFTMTFFGVQIGLNLDGVVGIVLAFGIAAIGAAIAYFMYSFLLKHIPTDWTVGQQFAAVPVILLLTAIIAMFSTSFMAILIGHVELERAQNSWLADQVLLQYDKSYVQTQENLRQITEELLALKQEATNRKEEATQGTWSGHAGYGRVAKVYEETSDAAERAAEHFGRKLEEFSKIDHKKTMEDCAKELQKSDYACLGQANEILLRLHRQGKIEFPNTLFISLPSLPKNANTNIQQSVNQALAFYLDSRKKVVALTKELAPSSEFQPIKWEPPAVASFFFFWYIKGSWAIAAIVDFSPLLLSFLLIIHFRSTTWKNTINAKKEKIALNNQLAQERHAHKLAQIAFQADIRLARHVAETSTSFSLTDNYLNRIRTHVEEIRQLSPSPSAIESGHQKLEETERLFNVMKSTFKATNTSPLAIKMAEFILQEAQEAIKALDTMPPVPEKEQILEEEFIIGEPQVPQENERKPILLATNHEH